MKTVFITGASRGIGRETALLFAKHGYHVAACSHASPEGLDSLKKEIETLYHGTCLSFCGDVSDASFVSKTVQNIYDAWGKIDVLINNAGISHVGILTDLSLDDWNRVLSVNLTSVFLTCHEVVPHMVHEKMGKIINVSSVWGEVGASCEVAYSASKGGVNALTMALAKELAPSNIQVNAIAPGCVDTSMNACFDAEEKAALEESIPAGRFATAAETAEFIYELSQAPAYLTGQTIRFDGGWI